MLRDMIALGRGKKNDSCLQELKEYIIDIQDGHKTEWGPNLPHRPACLMNLEVQVGSSVHFSSKDLLDGGNSSHNIISWEHSCCITWWALRFFKVISQVRTQNTKRIFVLDGEQFQVSNNDESSKIVGIILIDLSTH